MATGSNIDYDAIGQEKGGKVMCTLFDSIAKENDIIKRLQNKLNLSIQTSQEYFEMFGKQTV